MLKFLTIDLNRDDACNRSRMLDAVLGCLTRCMTGLTIFRRHTEYVYMQSVNTILGVSTSYSGERLEADTTAGPFLTIPSRKAKAFMEIRLRKRERARSKRRVTNEPTAAPKRDSYERHRKLYYIPGAFNMALQKLRVNCLIFVLARRQVRRVETKSEYEVEQTASRYNSRKGERDTANCVTAFRGYFEFCIKWIMSVLCFHFW